MTRDTLEWSRTTFRWDVDYAKPQRLQHFSRVERVTESNPHGHQLGNPIWTLDPFSRGGSDVAVSDLSQSWLVARGGHEGRHSLTCSEGVHRVFEA